MNRRVVLAPLAFKGSLRATEVAEAMADGAGLVSRPVECVVRPMADGGDGSLDALVSSGFDRLPIPARGPVGDPVTAAIALRRDVAAVELASTCGMARLPDGRLAPLASTTLGLGDAMSAALDHDPTELIVCLGGSASTDGGAGLLAALGARLLDQRGREVHPCGETLRDIADLDLTGLDPRLASRRITVAVDVTAPLLGPTGAAAVFGPQKGAGPADVAALEAGLATWHDVLARAVGRPVADIPGAGAAGGAAAALLGALGAQARPGAELIADAIGLADAIANADLVITGEGRLDAQTSLGKGAAWVAHLARSGGRPALAVCGSITIPAADLLLLGLDAWADCRSRAASDSDSVANAATLVASATRDLLDDAVIGPP